MLGIHKYFEGRAICYVSLGLFLATSLGDQNMLGK